MRRALAVLAALALVGCGSGGSDGDDGGASPGASTSSAGSSSAPAGGGSLAGTWRLAVEEPRLAFGTSHYQNATVTLTGNRIRVVGTTHYESSFDVPHTGEITIRCTASLCSAGLLGFQAEGSGYRLVNAAMLTPLTIESGASMCFAPAASEAHLVTDLTATSFSFVSGRSSKTQDSCYQVRWTIRATRVS